MVGVGRYGGAVALVGEGHGALGEGQGAGQAGQGAGQAGHKGRGAEVWIGEWTLRGVVNSIVLLPGQTRTTIEQKQ